MVRPEEQVSGARLDLDDVGSVRLRAVRSPQFSTIHWTLAKAAAGHLPQSRASSVARNPAARAAWAALGMPGLDRLPDLVMPVAPLGSSVSEQAARLRDTSGSELADRIHDLWGPTPPRPWQRAADRPQAWLTSLAEATLDVWASCTARWDRGQRVIDREISRIGTAVVTNTVDVLLNNLHPRLRCHGGILEFDSFCDKAFALDGRELVLIPMLTHSRIAVSFGHPGYAYVAYSLFGQAARRPFGERAERAERADALAALVGPIRATVLRMLDQARTMSELAARMYCAPSTATYHCKHLEDAGLVCRERRAQTVWVRRTARADELLDLFDADRL